MLSRVSKRRVRRAREAVIECRLAIDVARLRLELREALDDVRDSRLRLVEAAAIERRRLERDLHDGTQQQLIAIGMRLRSVQRRLSDDPDAVADIDLAVQSLEATVADLRRLAHGIRPALLDDGLATALARLTADIPLPIEVTIGDVEVSDLVATTVYFVVAEGITNALKHAAANQITVDVRAEGDGLRIEVADDGAGAPMSGARPYGDAPVGRGLSSLTDRVTALGGRLTITSEPGRGTTLLAVL
jgi:signal transduction histidine kinase